MGRDPYKLGLVKGEPYRQRRAVQGRLVAVMDFRMDDRGLELLHQPSRAICRGEIHELIVTQEKAEPGGAISAVAYLGFFEVDVGGVLRRGDELHIGSNTIGRVLGFDATHMPNHYNIVLHADSLQTGHERRLPIEAPVKFAVQPPEG